MAKVKMTSDDYKKYGTVKSGGKKKLPIKSAQSAHNALDLMGHTKPPLTPGQESTVRREAAKYGVKPGSTSDPKKNKEKK